MKLNKKILKNKYESGVEDRNGYHVKKRVNLSGGPRANARESKWGAPCKRMGCMAQKPPLGRIISKEPSKFRLL